MAKHMASTQMSEDVNLGKSEVEPSMNFSEKEFGDADGYCPLISARARSGATTRKSPRIKPKAEKAMAFFIASTPVKRSASSCFLVYILEHDVDASNGFCPP